MLTLETAQITQGSFTLHADLTLAPAQTYAVIGPSGAGKSTLLGALCGFIPLRAGRLLWQGKDITQAAPGARPMTMLFQDNNLFPHLSVMQNVGLGLRPDLRLGSAEQTRVHEALDRVGLQGMAARKPAELSGGQQSRVALARVLVQARPLVLLDEPFAALGPALRNDMLDLVAALAAETKAALIMVTHAPEDVRRIADQVIFVEAGTAHPPQPAAALMDNPPDALRAYLG
ncbi:Thiamine import ATP-binding protein ThiQ [Sulfitobacter pontiacus]|jgi:thiamine transport system ATP-binding protein|uniref:Thiamine import ATP-binding protein ThiQ n=1 Tax=Sulfitobacter pontiacus TaxID=60137 RepID=A0AAX3A7F6_9RHOB|nr:ATP-binding cassette domain-containing protein [Sulfitobacter pontiacus]UOA22097.1 Thiamine import ATP-binding protein ThiQ [Sulfitobacter pontiacus]WPZ25872.1 ATP-binding cassette domain-containing protein [Sulfitobacter pontiacus]